MIRGLLLHSLVEAWPGRAQQAAPGTQAVRGFEDLSRADIAFAGGKGANLGELTAAGLPVPPGSSWAHRPMRPFSTRAGCGRESPGG